MFILGGSHTSPNYGWLYKIIKSLNSIIKSLKYQTQDILDQTYKTMKLEP